MKKWYIDADDPSWIRERRVRKTEKFLGMQTMPQLAKLSCRCMLILPVLVVVLEVLQHFRYSPELGILHLLQKASLSALISWGFFEAILIIVSLIQLRRIRTGHVETVYITRDPGDHSDPFVPVKDPEPKYFRYMKIACVGGLVLAAVYVLFSFA